MAIAVGDSIPDVQLRTMTGEGPKPVSSTEVLGKGKVVLFAVPGAFTPTCSDHHLPGFVVRADEIRAKGVDTIVCLSVNDPFVMGAWGADQEVGDRVLMVADGNGEFTRAIGLELDGSGVGLGSRSQRYAAILEESHAIDWLEIITENYLVPGGKPLHYLERIRSRFPVVMHGVSLSIGSTDPLDREYLAGVRELARRIEPAWISDHLSWTGVEGCPTPRKRSRASSPAWAKCRTCSGDKFCSRTSPAI